jgi:nucleoid DNA-binding protein
MRTTQPEISAILLEALIQKKHCSLENLGAFFLVKIPARLDKKNHCIYPPVHTIRFNPGVRYSDPLLIAITEQKTGWNYEQCKSWLEHQTHTILEWVHWKKRIELPGMGVLRADEKNNLFFDTQGFVHYLDWGYEILPLFPVTTHESAEKKEPKIAPLQPKVASQKRFPVNFSRLAAAVLIPALLFLALWTYWRYDTWNRSQQIYLASVLGYSGVQSAYVFNSMEAGGQGIEYFRHSNPVYAFNSQGIARVEAEGIQLMVHNNNESTALTENTRTTSSMEIPRTNHSFKKPEDSHGRFMLIVGSFSLSSNAERFISRLRKKGYSGKIVGKSPSGLMMVSILESDDKEKVYNNLQQIRNEFSSAWIFKQ